MSFLLYYCTICLVWKWEGGREGGKEGRKEGRKEGERVAL